jgi:hypothetical protein
MEQYNEGEREGEGEGEGEGERGGSSAEKAIDI